MNDRFGLPEATQTMRRWVFALIVMLVVIAALYLSSWAYDVLRAGSNILALYFSAWLLQFFFSPVVDFLTRHRLPRVAAVLYVYLVLALLFVIAGIAIVPGIYSQVRNVAALFADRSTYVFITHVTRGIEDFLVHKMHLPPQDIKTFTDQYSVSLTNGFAGAGSRLQSIIRGYLTPSNIFSGTNTVFNIFSTISNAMLNLVIVLILAFYMTLDGRRLVNRALGYFPPVVGEIAESVHRIINRKFGGYLRGQFILAASYGFLTYLIVRQFNLQFQLFIAVFAAIMMLIPFVGTFAALVPPIIFFVVANPSFPVGTFLLLLVFLMVAQQIVLNVLAPRVMGSAVGMHPLLVVFGLLLGIKLAGLWGAIFGVPVFGVVVETADLIYRRVMERRYGFHPFEEQGDDDAGHPSGGSPGDDADTMEGGAHRPGGAAPGDGASRAGAANAPGTEPAARASVVLQAPRRPGDSA